MEIEKPFWIMRDYPKCSGCRRCEIACSLHHEGKIWPEASRVRVFMLVPGAEVPHLCAQCGDYPCIESCPYNALSVDPELKSVVVDKDACTACGNCIDSCPGRIPFIHPEGDYVAICDFCGGDPKCVKVCREGRWDSLFLVKRQTTLAYRLYAKTPEEVTKELVLMIYGEKGKELI